MFFTHLRTVFVESKADESFRQLTIHIIINHEVTVNSISFRKIYQFE